MFGDPAEISCTRHRRSTPLCDDTLPNFVHRQVFFRRSNEPPMPKRVGDAADAITIKLVGYLTHESGSSRHRTRNDAINVFHIQVNANRGASDRFGTERRTMCDWS
jgi:hypothetical protein